MSYYTLITSLPALPVHFDVERTPISLPRLEQRLRLLRADHVAIIERFRAFMAWDLQPLQRTDEEVVSEYGKLKENIRHSLVLDMVEHRVNMRTIVGALRRRHHRQPPPIGVGELVTPIRQHWQAPQFGLQRRHPWIASFDEHMSSGDAVAAERILYEVTWTKWTRAANEYTFSFEAVLLYLARWSIIDRWTSRDAAKGQERFDQLIEDTLGEYANLQF